MKKPLTPFDAASMAAYSNLRVESEVQYWTVAGGGGGGGVISDSGAEIGAGSVRTGNWKNLYG
jgi:hypothetical protein